MKAHIDIHVDRYRLTVQCGGLEPILANCLNRFLIETHPCTSNYPDVRWFAILVNPKIDGNNARVFRLPGLLAKLCFRRINHDRFLYFATDVHRLVQRIRCIALDTGSICSRRWRSRLLADGWYSC